jgi:serine protein kinase
MSIQDYLSLCRADTSTNACVPERMLMAIDEPEPVDTRRDYGLSHVFGQ